MDVEFIELSRPQRTHWLLVLGLTVLMVLAWALTGWSRHEIALRQIDMAQARVLAAEAQQRANAASRLPVKMPYEADAWHAWRLGRFEALGALRALEGVSGEGISLSNIDIDAEQGDVVIKFKAAGADVMDLYLRDLNARSQGTPWTISQVVSENTTGIPSMLVVTSSSHWVAGDPR